MWALRAHVLSPVCMVESILKRHKIGVFIHLLLLAILMILMHFPLTRQGQEFARTKENTCVYREALCSFLLLLSVLGRPFTVLHLTCGCSGFCRRQRVNLRITLMTWRSTSGRRPCGPCARRRCPHSLRWNVPYDVNFIWFVRNSISKLLKCV